MAVRREHEIAIGAALYSTYLEYSPRNDSAGIDTATAINMLINEKKTTFRYKLVSNMFGD